MDLKKGMDELHGNKTFKYILSAILTVGNFLNGTPVGPWNELGSGKTGFNACEKSFLPDLPVKSNKGWHFSHKLDFPLCYKSLTLNEKCF